MLGARIVAYSNPALRPFRGTSHHLPTSDVIDVYNTSNTLVLDCPYSVESLIGYTRMKNQGMWLTTSEFPPSDNKDKNTTACYSNQHQCQQLSHVSKNRTSVETLGILSVWLSCCTLSQGECLPSNMSLRVCPCMIRRLTNIN